MPTVKLRDAKASLSTLVDEAMNGEIITITRHRKPVAALISIETAEAIKKPARPPRPNFGEYLMSFPGGIDLDRNRSDS